MLGLVNATDKKNYLLSHLIRVEWAKFSILPMPGAGELDQMKYANYPCFLTVNVWTGFVRLDRQQICNWKEFCQRFAAGNEMDQMVLSMLKPVLYYLLRSIEQSRLTEIFNLANAWTRYVSARNVTDFRHLKSSEWNKFGWCGLKCFLI